MVITLSVIIWWILIGLVVGAVARLVIPGRQHIGILVTILIGIVAAIVGGLLTAAVLGPGHTVITFIVAVLLAALVGVTVPERLRMRELARRSAENAVLYETDLALARYRKRFGMYPAALTDLRRLEDPDGSIARLLESIAPGEYKPETDLASLAAGRTAKSRRGRRVGTLPASAADTTDAGIALTNYGLTLPGRDRVLGTADDLFIRDGRIREEAPSATFVKTSVATPTPVRARSN
jgi:uncharacterized membrane protein YeaQ/YmgE (transglycosylase-associated protein family)